MDGMEQTEVKVEEPQVTPADLADAVRAAALLADLSISQWSGEITDKKISAKLKEDAGAVGNTGRYVKNLLAGCDTALKTTRSAYAMARQVHYELTLPWVTNPHAAGGHNGARLLPTALFDKYLSRMSQCKRDAEEARDRFLADYDDLVTQAQANLAGLADPMDYPTADQVKAAFRLTFDFQPIPESSSFHGLSDGMMQRLSESLEKRQQRAIASAQAEMWSRVREQVGHLKERLEDTEGRFKEATVENVRSLIELLPGFNTTGDKRVDRIVTDLKDMLYAVDAKEIRKTAGVRENVIKDAGAIVGKLDQWGV